MLSKRGGEAKSFYFEKLEKMQQNNFSELLRKKKAQCYQAKKNIRKTESLASADVWFRKSSGPSGVLPVAEFVELTERSEPVVKSEESLK